MRTTTWMVTAGAALLAATAAWAVSVEEVRDHAERLHDRLQVIQAGADACPGGECGEAADIAAAHADLQPELADVRDGRAALGSCNCGALDELIAQVESTNDAVSLVLGEWEDDEL